MQIRRPLLPHTLPCTAAFLASAAGAALATGCTTRVDATPEQVGTVSEAVFGGTVDVSTPASDVVVELEDSQGGGCSGTLVSPRLVLIAAHCIQDKSLTWTAMIGYDRYSTRPERHSIQVWSLPNVAPYVSSHHSPGQDVALIALDQPVLDEVIIPHPKLAPGAGPAGFAGYSPYERDHTVNPTYDAYRTMAPLASLDDLGHGSDDDLGGSHWFWESTSVGLAHGDSGGPLFWVDADGTRQVVGVASVGNCSAGLFGCDPDTQSDRFYWADVTGDSPGANWLRATALETAHPDVIQHTTAWYLTHHLSPSTYWLGEVDYTGPCDPFRDADCDHWYDANDNCPAVYNPGQEDTGDWGIGDACYSAPPAPGGCTASPGCSVAGALSVTVSCASVYGLATPQLQLDMGGGNYQTVYGAQYIAGAGNDASLVDANPPQFAQASYRVCVTNPKGTSCSDPISLYTSYCAGGGGGGGTPPEPNRPPCFSHTGRRCPVLQAPPDVP